MLNKREKQDFFIAGVSAILTIVVIVLVMFVLDLDFRLDNQEQQLFYLMKEQGEEMKQLKEERVPEPRDRINGDNILVYRDQIIINHNDTHISEYAGTGSMLPMIFKGANGISVLPKTTDEIVVDDVISFTKNGKDYTIHRVKQVGNDSEGWFAITRGDNNKVNDPGKVRFNQIGGVLVGILY